MGPRTKVVEARSEPPERDCICRGRIALGGHYTPLDYHNARTRNTAAQVRHVSDTDGTITNIGDTYLTARVRQAPNGHIRLRNNTAWPAPFDVDILWSNIPQSQKEAAHSVSREPCQAHAVDVNTIPANITCICAALYHRRNIPKSMWATRTRVGIDCGRA